VLPGTKMRSIAKEKELKYSPLPPYEILQTPDMSPSDLRTAMHISRMVDLYYNSDAWQDVTRSLIRKDSGFILKYTEYLKNTMVLDSPVSLERRGMILYEYCRKHLPESLSDVSEAWIQAGFSLKKEPAGNTIRIKHPEQYLEENGLRMSIEYGQASPSHRYYLFTEGNRLVLFGYDSQTHHPSPSFMAYLKNRT